jgi:opacity protein-like surface antigen
MEKFRAPRFAVLLIAFSTALGAQSLEHYDENGEFSIYTGLAAGPLGTHPTVGGSAGVFFSKYAGILVDSGFIPLGSRTLIRYPNATRTSRLFDNNLTAHIQIPINHRWMPYGLLGAAVIYNTYQIQRLDRFGVLNFHGQSDVKFGVETGAGARFFIREDWGVKGEFRYTVSTQRFSRALFGIFYRLPSTWP